jgi:hypothetical protein
MSTSRTVAVRNLLPGSTVTITNHGLRDGDVVRINGKDHVITGFSTGAFTIKPLSVYGRVWRVLRSVVTRLWRFAR